MIEKLKKYGFFRYGQIIPGLTIYGQPAPYPVLNERAIRAGAGIMFALGIFAFFQAFYLRDFLYIKIVVVIFFFDFLMKVVVGTKFSPITRLSDLVVRKQQPEYVGAIQKRFAWGIGLMLSGVMLLLLFVFGVQGLPNMIICGICLAFMFMETAFGICVGCKIYSALLAKGILKQQEHKPACAGNVCAITVD
ncbi:DUF4395 domain-containing protein [Candidatus Kaiserbacteria bacterium]|nr:DUF4395 domain-containing protein [Candidatus Kaiserbacteria bacterium]USN92637.1 MAG: DUF4395 domain-containing protein [Candidatus Nomurabacteria bacterium]